MADLSQEQDERLMVLYLQGDFEAFQEIYARHSGKVYAYLKCHLSQKAEAEDLFQSVFLKFHQSRHRYDESLPLLPWLFAITRNALIDHLRRKKLVPVEDEKLVKMSDLRVGTEIEGHIPQSRDVVAAFSGLSPDQKKVLELRFSEGLSFEEISKRTGLTSQTARKRVSRFVEKVKKSLGMKE